jgi:hypothetical protein
MKRERARFTVMHLRKKIILRRIIGSHPQRELSVEEQELVGEMLSALDFAIEAHENRIGLKIAE